MNYRRDELASILSSTFFVPTPDNITRSFFVEILSEVRGNLFIYNSSTDEYSYNTRTATCQYLRVGNKFSTFKEEWCF